MLPLKGQRQVLAGQRLEPWGFSHQRHLFGARMSGLLAEYKSPTRPKGSSRKAGRVNGEADR